MRCTRLTYLIEKKIKRFQEKVAFKRVKNNARISYSERKQLGRSQNIKHAKVLIFIVKVYLNGEFIDVPLTLFLLTERRKECIFARNI